MENQFKQSQRLQEMMNPKEKYEYEIYKKSKVNNKIYLYSLMIGMIVIFVMYICFISNTFNIKSNLLQKFQNNEGIKLLLNWVFPITVGILSLYPAYILLQPAITRALDDNKTTNLRFRTSIVVLLITLGLLISGFIGPIMLMYMSNPVEDNFRNLNLFESEREDLMWCILAVIIGSCLLILANIYALRYILLGTAIIGSSSGFKDTLRFILYILASTGTATGIQLFISRTTRKSLTDHVNDLSDEDLSALNAALDRNFPNNTPE